MKSLVQKLGWLSLAVAIALPLAAQDKEKKKNKKGGAQAGVIAEIKKKLQEVTLTEEQNKKVEALYAEYGPKLKEATEKAGDAPKRMADARKKLSADGKKGKELQAAIKDEAKLSSDEQAAFDNLQKISTDLRNSVNAVLTDEQKEKAQLVQQKGKKKKAA